MAPRWQIAHTCVRVSRHGIHRQYQDGHPLPLHPATAALACDLAAWESGGCRTSKVHSALFGVYGRTVQKKIPQNSTLVFDITLQGFGV